METVGSDIRPDSEIPYRLLVSIIDETALDCNKVPVQ